MQKNNHRPQLLLAGFMGVTLFGLIVTLLVSKQQNQPPEVAIDSPSDQSGLFPPGVLVLPEFSFLNSHGASVSNENFIGKFCVADIIFTRCSGPCAMMTQRMKHLQEAVSDVDDVQFLSLTADPNYDTQEILSKYAEKFEAQTETWHFLTGEKEMIYRFAMEGLKLAVDENDPESNDSYQDLFIHSTRFVLIDPAGSIRGYFDGRLEETETEIIEAIQSIRTSL
jgi:protein SCO1/2